MEACKHYLMGNRPNPMFISRLCSLVLFFTCTQSYYSTRRRALVLSVDNLIQTTLEFCLAPMVGYIADTYSIEAVFLVLGVSFLLINAVLLAGGWEARSGETLL